MRPNLAVLRCAILPMLTETGRVDHPTGTVYDPATQSEVPQVVTTYTGPLLVQPKPGAATEEAGGTTWVVGKYDVTLPADTSVVTGDRIIVTSAPFDAALVGISFRVLDVPVDSWQVARYCTVERFT